MSAAQVCRLCLSAENLVWVFDERFDRPDHMRDVIFITTGVEIHYKDIVSQKICTKCGQDALKMFQFRQEAIKNDTYLKAQCRHLMNDTHHKIPNTSGTIKSEETSNNEEPPPINGIHASVISLSRQYPTLHLPSLCLSDDVQPFVSLEMDAVENYLKNRKQLTLKSPEISSKVPPINIRRNLTKSGGYAIVRHSIDKENSSNTTQSAMTQPINNKRKRTHDYREKKVHKHVKMSRRQRPLSCKARFRVAKLRKSHIHRSLLIRKALKKQPIVAVERIDTNFEVRRQYPHCFEDLLTIGCAEVIEILSDDEEGPSVTAQASIATSVITPNLMIKNNCVLGQLNVEEGSELDIVKEPHCCVMRGAEVIEIPSDDEVVTTTAPSVIVQARQRTFISTSVVKPAVTIKNSRILDRLNLKAGSELDIIKDVLVKCAKLDVASQTEEPSTTETATASQPSRTKQMQLWGDLKPIDVITHSNRQTAESDSNCSNELAMDITRATAVNPSNNDQQMAETASTSTSSQSVDVASATSLISNASYAVRALSQTESIPARSPLAASTPSLLEILLNNDIKTSGIRNAGLPETSRTQQVCVNANVETIPREKITLLSNNVKTSGIRNAGLSETSRTQQVCANANVETIPREKITLLSNNVKTSGIRNAGLPEISRTQHVCANANVETIPREKITLLSNNVKTSGIRNAGLHDTSRTQQVCANANVETIPRETITCEVVTDVFSEKQHEAARFGPGFSDSGSKHSRIKAAKASRTQRVCANDNLETITGEEIICGAVDNIFGKKQRESPRFGPGVSDSRSKQSRFNWYVDNSTTDSSNLRVNATFMPPVQLVVRDHQSSSTFSGQITRPSVCPSTSNVVFNTQSKLQRYSTRFPAAPAEKAAVGAPSDHFPSYNSRLLFNRLDLFNQYSCDSNGGVSVGSVSHLQMNGFSGADELTAQNAEAGKRFAMPNRIRVKNMCELR